MRLKDLRACYELAKKLEVSHLACKDVGGRKWCSKEKVSWSEGVCLKCRLVSRCSVEHCTPHADGAWLNELGWSSNEV